MIDRIISNVLAVALIVAGGVIYHQDVRADRREAVIDLAVADKQIAFEEAGFLRENYLACQTAYAEVYMAYRYLQDGEGA